MEYYTSVYDLSGFFSDKYGSGLRYIPAIGTGSLAFRSGRIWQFMEAELRTSEYLRFDSLKAFTLGLLLGFEL